jgi:hypothetical protein
MPARLREIAAALKLLGVTVDEPKGGSHFMIRGQGTRAFPLTAHNGMRSEISDLYIKKLCDHLGIDFKSFKKSL